MENHEPELRQNFELRAILIPTTERPIEKQAEVLTMLCSYLDKYLVIYGIDDLDIVEPIVISRAGALALGMTKDGSFPDEVDLYEIDKLMSDSINPSQN